MKKFLILLSTLVFVSFVVKAETLRILAEAGDEATLTIAAKQFEEANPGVTIEASYLGWDDFMATIKLKLADNNPPDIAHGNQGFTVDGTLVKNNLIIPLDKYADQYGWKNLFAEGSLKEFMWTQDGNTWGDGSLYGISAIAEDVIVYYNKSKLNDLGLSVPSSFEEFESALATAKSAGELPIVLGGADGWPIIHVWGLIEGGFVDTSQTRSWIFDPKNNEYNTSSRMQAAKKLEEMVSKGYFGSDSLGIGYDDANSMFINGEAHGPDRLVTTCQLHMRKFKDGDTIVIEPFRARAFPVIKDLIVDRSSFDRIQQAGGFVSVNTSGNTQDANAIPIDKHDADKAFDAATCIGCGACVASCKNASAMLFVSAKVSQYSLLPQGKVEATDRVLNMVNQMDEEGFGNCTNTGACEIECPKGISLENIARLNREYLAASIKD